VSLALPVSHRLSSLVIGLTNEVIDLRILESLSVVLSDFLNERLLGLMRMLSGGNIVSLTVGLTRSDASSDRLGNLLVMLKRLIDIF
jgi:hypothetical protein